MDSLKSDTRVKLLAEVGSETEDRLERSIKSQAAHAGAKQALLIAAKNIQGLAAVVDEDLTHERIPSTELGIAKYAKLMIARAVASAESLSRHHENLEIATGGERAAYSSMVEQLKKKHDKEKSIAKQMIQAIEAGDVNKDEAGDNEFEAKRKKRRPTKVRPAPSIAAKRKADEKTKPKKKAPKTKKKPKAAAGKPRILGVVSAPNT